MRKGATISGGMHLGILALVLFGVDLFADRDPYPLAVTEVELIDGANFDAAVSTAPVVPNQGPAELSPQSESDVQALDVKKPDVTVSAPPMPRLRRAEKPDDSPPDVAAIRLPPPPTDVPTEAPRPSIAEIPSPDPLKHQAAEPESPPATEPLQALASAPSLSPAPAPVAAPEPEPVVAETPQPEPEKPEKPEPEPDTLTEVQPDAPLAPAPQEARLPVAKPAELAKAAQASSAQKPVETAEKPEKEPKPDTSQETAAAKPEPAKEPKPAGGSASAFAAALSNGEKDALRLGIKRYFVFNGNRSDRTLRVTVEIQLGENAKIIGQPQLLRASGGDPATQDALFRAGNRALRRAENAGEFTKLPRDKYASWQVIHVTFTPEEIGFQS